MMIKYYMVFNLIEQQKNMFLLNFYFSESKDFIYKETLHYF